MTITYIEFMPIAKAITLQPFPGDVLVSITEPDCTPKPIFQDGWKDIVRLEFWDIEAIKDRMFYPINDAQANEIADFIRRHHEGREDVRLMVHCRAGISRSAGVALAAFEFTQYSGNEAEFPGLMNVDRRNALVCRKVMDALGMGIINV